MIDLEEFGPAVMMKKLDKEVRSAIYKGLRGNKDEAIRKRVIGSDDLTKKYLGRMKSMVSLSIRPIFFPSLSVTSSCVHELKGAGSSST